VHRSERVDVTKLPQPWNNAELSVVPLGSALGSQPASGVARERDDLAVGKFTTWGVEVATKYARARSRGRQTLADRLQRSNLHPAICCIRDMNAMHLNGT
jgi:hypothetical protein